MADAHRKIGCGRAFGKGWGHYNRQLRSSQKENDFFLEAVCIN